jgi:hypothetical protein
LVLKRSSLYSGSGFSGSYPHHGTTQRHSQCGTVMIYCGSDSYFGKVLVPVPDPELISTVFNHKKCVQNLAFSILDAALFPRKLASKFRFF